MIPDRIHQARLAAGLTLGTLGARSGISHDAIKKFEAGVLTPSSSQLLKLACACGVRTEYFFRTHAVELLHVEFRMAATFGKTAQEAMRIRVIGLVEKRVELLGVFPESPIGPFQWPRRLPARLGESEEVEFLAGAASKAWQIVMTPTANLADTLEGLGLLFIVVDDDRPGFSGLTAVARTEDGRKYPVIVVSPHGPEDRQRFMSAREGLFDQVVFRALAQQCISEGKAAELLGIPMMRFHKARQLDIAHAVTH